MARVLFLIAGLFLGVSLLATAHAEDKPICSAVLYEDAELMKALPERLRPIVESARVKTLIANREAAWADFHKALDRALVKPGEAVIGEIDGYGTRMMFKKKRFGGLELWLDVLPSGERSAFRFLDFVAAELGWIAKARAQGKITGLKIVGHEIKNAPLADALASIGFRKSLFPGPRCFLMGTVGGIAGFVGGKVFFTQYDSDEENGSIYDEQRKYYRDIAAGSLLGSGSAIALACFKKTGRNYSIEFKPDELPPLPDRRTPGDPIPDEPSPFPTRRGPPTGDTTPSDPFPGEPPPNEPVPQAEPAPGPTLGF